MLLEGASMQVSFLKDLVTMRDPTSPRSFLAYLRDKDRLADFINNKSLFPSRVEFHDYLEWAASGVEELVDYGTRAVAVHPVRRDDEAAVTELDVVLRDLAAGERRTVRNRNLVGQADAARLPRQHQLLGGRPGAHRRALRQGLPGVALINGESQVGITAHWMDADLDRRTRSPGSPCGAAAVRWRAARARGRR